MIATCAISGYGPMLAAVAGLRPGCRLIIPDDSDWLRWDAKAVDLVELSGGSYESPAMQGQTRDGSSLAREAYFLEFAERIGKIADMPPTKIPTPGQALSAMD
ncbi:hypothetical protein BK636_14030 [Pseudomonas chlororaphis]|nr:hypothetical protein BK636_14030 [Pseudomonas chlororaphis]